MFTNRSSVLALHIVSLPCLMSNFYTCTLCNQCNFLWDHFINVFLKYVWMNFAKMLICWKYCRKGKGIFLCLCRTCQNSWKGTKCIIYPCLLFFLFFLPLPNAMHSSFWKRIQGQILNRLQELMPNRPFLSISLLASSEYKVHVPINLSLKQGL